MTPSNLTQQVIQINLKCIRFSKLSSMVSLLMIVRKAWLFFKTKVRMLEKIHAKVKAMGLNPPQKRQNHPY
jgi:hypothetical protein